MRIGLTGANGTLGARIEAELSIEGYDVRRFDGDVRNAEAIQRWIGGLDTVIHAAAIVPVQRVQERLHDAIAVNVAGTANIARAVSKSDRCRLIYVSTSHVYSPKPTPLREADTTEPISLYGLTKLQGEVWVQRLVRESLIVRVFSFFESRQQPPFLLPSLADRIKSARLGASLELRGAASVRDIVDGKWIARVCATLVGNGHIGIVNCGSGKGYSIQRIAETLAGVLGRYDLTWRSTADPHDTVVADTENLQKLVGNLPPFDLKAALACYVNECAV